MPLYVWRLVRNGAPGVMPNRALFFYPRGRPPVPPVYRYPLSLFRRSALRSRGHPRPPPDLPWPRGPPPSSPRLAPTRFFASAFFFPRGEKMRAARRLVEGTDDVVSDVPPPGTLGGGDARETMVRGRAVECELRHRPGVHISGGCRCWTQGVGLRSNWMEILLHRRSLGEP